MVWLPKLIEDGLTLATGAWPVPDSEIDRVEGDAVLVTVSVPVDEPGAVGVNVKWSVRLWPVLRVMLPVKPFTENGAVVCTALTVMLVVPEFVTVNDCGVLAVPTVSGPKLKEVVLGVRVAEGEGVVSLLEPLTMPEHPANSKARTRASVRRMRLGESELLTEANSEVQ